MLHRQVAADALAARTIAKPEPRAPLRMARDANCGAGDCGSKNQRTWEIRSMTDKMEGKRLN